jgi:acyl-CoA synthetase (AMP-forming)/AMP-acid ligase II
VNPETGEILPRGEIGEICARGYGIMKDYFDNPAGTTAAIDLEGWLHTGDLGSLDERGCCRVQGRAKDLIIRGGENIYPREIESAPHAPRDSWRVGYRRARLRLGRDSCRLCADEAGGTAVSGGV